MSSIRLSGSTSGHYDLTVPAVAGTNSIDLSKMTVQDSNGNITVSHSAAGGAVQVIVLNSNGVATVGNKARLHLGATGTGAHGSVLISEFTGIANTNHRTDLIIQTTPGSSVLREHMRIDGDGRVTTPYQPMCSAGGGTTSSAATQEVTNMSVIVNNGNHYNTSNGRFTCPVAGIYEVNVHMLSNYVAAYNWVAIFKNGSPFQNMHWNPDSASGHHYTGLSCLVSCAANDTLSGGIQNVNNLATAQVASFFLTVKLIG